MNRASASAAFLRSTLRIVLACFEQFEIGGVGRVILQHVQDEIFLDGLAHGVSVERLTIRGQTPPASYALGWR